MKAAAQTTKAQGVPVVGTTVGPNAPPLRSGPSDQGANVPDATLGREFADERLGTITEQAKAEGLKVYTYDTDGPIRQVYVTDGVHIGTLGVRDIICIGTGTIHKPCRECGTGYGLKVSDRDTVDLQAVKEAMITHAPAWATPTDRAAVRKYASWEDYATRNNWTTYTQL